MATGPRPLDSDSGPDLSGLTHRRVARELGRDVVYNEIGTVGFDASGGYIRESRLNNFKGVNRAKVIREMAETDAIVKGLLSNYTMLAQAAERTVVPGGESEADQEAADFIDTCLDDMELSWKDTVGSIMSMLAHGFSYHEINYKIRGGMHPAPIMVEKAPGVFEEKEAPSSKYDDGKIGWWGWPIRLQETIQRWEFDDNGRIKGAWQRPKSFKRGEHFIPLDKALHFRTSARRGDPLGESMLESAYRSWFFLRNFQELTGIGVKRDSTGLLTLKVPKDWGIWSQAGATKLAELEKLVANVQRDEYEGLIIPDDVEATLLSSAGQRQFDLIAIQRQLWLEIALATLTDFALIGHEQIGARSLKEESTRIFLIALQGILDNIAEIINRHAIPPLIELNNMSVTEMPQLVFSTVDVPSVKEIIEALTQLSQAGMEIFPNQQIGEAVLTMLRLPVEEMGENFEEMKERREEMMDNNPLFGGNGGERDEDEEEDEDQEEDGGGQDE